MLLSSLLGTVQFSSGSSGGGNKEILVQHLLVGGDDLKLLAELQKKISEGLVCLIFMSFSITLHFYSLMSLFN